MDQKNVQPVNVLRAAGAMGVAVFFSRIAGLLREQVFAYLFGAGLATDAFNVAFRIPNLLRDLFAEGAMSAALIPTFTRVRAEEGEARSWRLAGRVFRTLAVLSIAIAGLGMVFAPQLVSLYTSAEYQAIGGKLELTVWLTRLMFPFFPLVVVAAAFMGILNARGRFFMPAFASALFNVTSIAIGATLAILLPRYGVPGIVGMAVGVVAGGAVQALCQLPQLYGSGYRWAPRVEGEVTWSADPALRRMLVLMLPGMVGLAATQINILVNTMLATSQPAAVSWLNYAFRLMQFPIGIFGVSLAAATLPRISQLWVEKDLSGAATTLERSLRQAFAINLPASAGLAFLGVPIIQLLFQYGRFHEGDTQATALALAAYATGLTAYSAVKILVPACYAFGNTRVAVVSSVLSVAVNITLNLLLVGPLGYVGLALGTSAAAFFNAVFLLGALRSILRGAGGEFRLAPVFRGFLAYTGVALAMGVILLFSQRGLAVLLPEPALTGAVGRLGIAGLRAARVLALVLEGLLIVLLLSRVARLPELGETVELFLGKLKKKLSRKKN